MIASWQICKVGLPLWQVKATMQQVDSKFSPDPAGANALALALERVME